MRKFNLLNHFGIQTEENLLKLCHVMLISQLGFAKS